MYTSESESLEWVLIRGGEGTVHVVTLFLVLTTQIMRKNYLTLSFFRAWQVLLEWFSCEFGQIFQNTKSKKTLFLKTTSDNNNHRKEPPASIPVTSVTTNNQPSRRPPQQNQLINNNVFATLSLSLTLTPYPLQDKDGTSQKRRSTSPSN